MTTIELIRRGAASDFATIITPEQCAEIIDLLTPDAPLAARIATSIELARTSDHIHALAQPKEADNA